MINDREENSEIDVTSGFYVLFGSGKILVMNLMIVEIDFLFITDPPQLRDQQEAVGWAIYIYICVYNVNISYEAMVFGASFTTFLFSFFIWWTAPFSPLQIWCLIALVTFSLTDILPRLRAVGWNISHPNRMSPRISKMNPLLSITLRKSFNMAVLF